MKVSQVFFQLMRCLVFGRGEHDERDSIVVKRELGIASYLQDYENLYYN
jgi:hypothetical protein